MKKITFNIIALLSLCFASCNEDWLDTTPGNKYDDAAVWSDPELAKLFVNGIYLGIPYPHQWLMNASLVDEAVFIQTDGIATRVTDCLMTPDEQAAFAESVWAVGMQDWNWNNVYKRIRACNVFFEKIEGTPFADESEKNELKGEVHFLRGFYYYLLMAQYGGVPLIAKAYDLDEDFGIARNSFEETVNFIVADLDSAAAWLPLVGDKTRGTQGAALALKSRVLLYAASDLYHSNASWAGGYAQPELVGYVGGDRTARWQAAKDAAKAVIDLGIYSLYQATPAPEDDITQNFDNVFLERSDEDIFLQYYDKEHFPYYATDWTPTICSSAGYGGFGLNQIAGNLADAFEMKDGSTFDWNNPAHRAAPYANRDPRFYATLLYEGASWMGRPVQVGHWSDGTAGPDYASFGTGYYLRKFIDPNFNHVYYGDRPKQPWVHFRYAEILLNYAEACIGLGQEEEARTYINMIRTRAGMPPVSDTGQDLIDRYRNERRVELAYEQHRFFDVRRWMIADQAYVPARGVEVLYQTAGSTDDPVITQTVVEPNRNWKDSHYLIPIARSEMNKNGQLIQNPLY